MAPSDFYLAGLGPFPAAGAPWQSVSKAALANGGRVLKQVLVQTGPTSFAVVWQASDADDLQNGDLVLGIVGADPGKWQPIAWVVT